MPASVIRQDGRGTWTFDATETEDFDPQIEVTDHPIEDGSTVSDHANAKPLTIRLPGLVTETPFADGFKATAPNRVKKAVEFFRALEGKLVTVVSQKLGSFENCLLTGYPHTVTVREGVVLQCGFKQITVAQSEQVELPPERIAPKHEASVADEQDVGRQATSEEEEALWNHMNNKGGGTFFY